MYLDIGPDGASGCCHVSWISESERAWAWRCRGAGGPGEVRVGRKGQIGRGYLAVGSDALVLALTLHCGSQHRSHVLPSPRWLISIPRSPPPPRCFFPWSPCIPTPLLVLSSLRSPHPALFFTRTITSSYIPTPHAPGDPCPPGIFCLPHASWVLSVSIQTSLTPSPSFPQWAYRWGGAAHAQGVRQGPGGCSDTAAHPAGSGCQA